MQNILKLLAGSIGFCAIAMQCESAIAMSSLTQDSLELETTAEEILELGDRALLANASPSVSDLLSETQSASIGQVTSVSQLSDVFPTDWAFQSLQSLVERYGCIAGYPDGTFRGNRSATRYELAAALNACLDNISDKFATKEDLEAVRALQEEFQSELATLRGRVDGLEARTATLEAQQFSTTTKLQGEVVMAGQFGDFVNNPTNTTAALGAGNIGGSRASVLSRVRLNFNTSFSGDDLLQTQLEVGNNGQDFFTANGFLSGANPLPLGAPLGSAPLVDLGAVDYSSINNNVTLRRLAYSFKPFGDDFTATVGSNIFPSDFIDFNSYANNSAQDFSSGFLINNPLIIADPIDVAGGAGVAFDWNANGGPFSVRGLYVAANAQNAAGNTPAGIGNVTCFVACQGGLGNDPHQASLELELANLFGSNSQNSYALRFQGTFSETFGIQQKVAGLNAEATFGDFGVFGRYAASFNPRFLGADLFGAGGLLPGDTLVQSWMGGVGLRDLGVPGSLLSVAGGMPFLVTNDGAPNQTNLEMFYRVPVSDNITLTPTVMYIINPGNTSNAFATGANENDLIQGLLRATFSF